MDRLEQRTVILFARAAIAAFFGLIGGVFGLHLGEGSAYLLARATERDIAELKDVLVWMNLSGAVIAATAGVWLALRLTQASLQARNMTAVVFAVAVLGGAALTISAYEPPKTSGTPVVEYELRLPAGFPPLAKVNYSFRVQAERFDQGGSVEQVRRAGDRQEVSGSLVLPTDTASPTMSLLIFDGLPRPVSYWRLAIAKDAPLEKTFGPWQRIDFLPTLRPEAPPLPAGEYEIRYRVRRYI